MANIDSSNFINNSILSYVLFYWSPNAVRSKFFSCSSEAERFLLRLIRNHIVKWTSNFDVLTFAWFEFDAKWQMNALATYLQAQSVYLWSTVHIRPEMSFHCQYQFVQQSATKTIHNIPRTTHEIDLIIVVVFDEIY